MQLEIIMPLMESNSAKPGLCFELLKQQQLKQVGFESLFKSLSAQYFDFNSASFESQKIDL